MKISAGMKIPTCTKKIKKNKKNYIALSESWSLNPDSSTELWVPFKSLNLNPTEGNMKKPLEILHPSFLAQRKGNFFFEQFKK